MGHGGEGFDFQKGAGAGTVGIGVAGRGVGGQPGIGGGVADWVDEWGDCFVERRGGEGVDGGAWQLAVLGDGGGGEVRRAG